jgi:hypothetical protein
MPTVVTINRPDVVELIETVANRHTGGNKTEAVALALRRLLDLEARKGSLFGIHRGSVTVREGVDLTEPVSDEPNDAETGKELEH